MSHKLYILNSHLHVLYKSHKGAHIRERFNNIKLFERRYKGQYNERTFGDYMTDQKERSNVQEKI